MEVGSFTLDIHKPCSSFFSKHIPTFLDVCVLTDETSQSCGQHYARDSRRTPKMIRNDSQFQYAASKNFSGYSQSVVTYGFIFSISAYFLLSYLNILPGTASQALWSGFVHLIPSRLVMTLDNRDGTKDNSFDTLSFNEKSEAIRRILGLNTDVFANTIQRARSLSGIGGVLGGRGAENMPPGLGNWDNSCYQNSIIQGFASLPSLQAFLANNLDELGEKGGFKTHSALKGVIEQLNDPNNYGRKLWTPADLKSMSSWQQQDAQEYFSKVVDQMDREVASASKGRTTNPGLKQVEPYEVACGMIVENNQDQGLALDTPERSSTAAKPFLSRNPLEGLLAQRVGCMKCGWTEGLSLIPFNCLTVPLGRKWEYDIRECFDEYTALEPIEGVECAKCTLLRARAQLEKLLNPAEDELEHDKETAQAQLSETFRNSVTTRLLAVKQALEDEDFSENTLAKKCFIASRNRVSTTKSRQAVIARAPESLVVHVNRSVFDEMTGAQSKNYANVKFPKTFDLDHWCLGMLDEEDGGIHGTEQWTIDPSKSMLEGSGPPFQNGSRTYELRAVITHYGRHENGHYICYRKFPVPEGVTLTDAEDTKRDLSGTEQWFRLSDDDVSLISEGNVLAQGGVFMLFYEAIETLPPSVVNEKAEEPTVVEVTAPSDLSEALNVTGPVLREEQETNTDEHIDQISVTDDSIPLVNGGPPVLVTEPIKE